MSPSQQEADFIISLGRRLRANGEIVNYIPQNRATKKRVRELSIEERILDLPGHDPIKGLSELLDIYNVRSPKMIVFPQMAYDYNYPKPSGEAFSVIKKLQKRKFGHCDSCIQGQEDDWPNLFSTNVDYSPYIEFLHKCLDYIHNLFERGDGGIPLQNQGGEILRRVLQRVADAHDTSSLWVGESPFRNKSGFYTSEKFTIFDGKGNDFDEVSKYSKNKKIIDEHIQRIKEEQPIIGIKDQGPVSRITNSIRDQSVPHPVGVAGFLRDNIISRINKKKYYSSEKSRKIIKNCKYIYYPLQYPRESRVTMRAPEFYNQFWLVEYLSRCLPSDIELVTKAHPNHVAFQSRSARRMLKTYSYPLHPHMNSHSIIEYAEGVVTLNGTVGYEALIHGKPVAALGHAVYTHPKITMEVDSIEGLDSAVSYLISSNGIDYEEIKKLVSIMYNKSYSGVWGNITSSNIINLTESVLKYLGSSAEQNKKA